MKFCENMKLKIIIIIIGYNTLNNFTTLFHNIIVVDWKYICNLKIKKTNSFFEKKIYIYCFVNVETDPSLR